MFNVIIAEALKLKRSKVLLLLLIPAILVAAVNINTASEIVSHSGHRWLTLLSKTQLLAAFFSPAFITIFTGYVFIREYSDNTAGGMFTYPFSRSRILLAKLILMILVVAAMFLLVILFGILTGYILNIGPLTLGILPGIIGMMAASLLLHSALLPASVLAGILSRNNTLTAVFGLASTILTIMLFQTRFSVYFPLCFPSLVVLNASGKDALFEYVRMFRYLDGTGLLRAFTIYAAFLAVIIGCNIISYKNSEAK